MKKKQTKCIMFIIILILMVILPTSLLLARDSVFTQKGTGLMYWTTYEYQYENDTYMPEDRWKAQIDWVAENFKQYGYTMVCADGWIEEASRHNSNGYVITHNDSWVHDWPYWADYCNTKGLNMGIYMNPLWIHETVRDDPDCYIVGTQIPVSSLTHADDVFDSPNHPGSIFYWVDVNAEGAEQFVKGYVNYFKTMGVTFLRSDFWCMYEAGGWGAWKHGMEDYETAMRWIEEACGNDMFNCPIMGNMYDKAAMEKKYADALRISYDTFDGGWGPLSSDRRGQFWNSWPPTRNAFDGFVAFSNVAGKGKFIMDGDCLRMNTFANDDERKFAISLYLMAGAPIPIADQSDTIGSHAWVYQNTEMLELNSNGFVGRPFSFELLNSDNQYWKGQLSSDTWIVGLFNREVPKKTRSIDFAEDLGILDSAPVRDLWEHADLGSMTYYSETIPKHSCRILKITDPTPPKTGRLEAENGIKYGTSTNYPDSYASGGYEVIYINTPGSSVEFSNVAVSTQITIGYCTAAAAAETQLYINGIYNQTIYFPGNGVWEGEYVEKTVYVDVPEGATLAFRYEEGLIQTINIDYIEVQ